MYDLKVLLVDSDGTPQRQIDVKECVTCSAIVMNEDIHDAWHAMNNTMKTIRKF